MNIHSIQIHIFALSALHSLYVYAWLSCVLIIRLMTGAVCVYMHKCIYIYQYICLDEYTQYTCTCIFLECIALFVCKRMVELLIVNAWLSCLLIIRSIAGVVCVYMYICIYVSEYVCVGENTEYTYTHLFL